MKETMDHSDFELWLDLEAADELSAAERARLDEHVAGCGRCRDERRQLGRLHALLAESRVPVRAGFKTQVMASLPVAPWEARAPRSWRLPLAAAVLLFALAGALLGAASADLGALPGAVAAMGDLFGTALLAGAGLLAASWKGTGLVVQDALGETPGGFAAFAVLVVGLNLLLVSLLRSRRQARQEASAPEER